MRALKALVRLQAIFRGRQVRKQAAITLRCMQALVRAQARVRAQSIQTSLEAQSLKNSLPGDPIKLAEVTISFVPFKKSMGNMRIISEFLLVTCKNVVEWMVW